MRVHNYLGRIEVLLERHTQTVYGDLHTLYIGALTIAEALYGRTSPRVKEITRYEPPLDARLLRLKRSQRAVVGALEAMRGDLLAGLIPAPELQGAGRVLDDLVSLSRSLRSQGLEVSAVLAAAAFEDTLRRLADAHLDLPPGQKLESVVQALTEAGILSASEKRIALNQLPFRNEALHAQWGKITGAAIEGALAFVDEQVSKHFLVAGEGTPNPGGRTADTAVQFHLRSATPGAAGDDGQSDF
jgi:hypothetical protein